MLPALAALVLISGHQSAHTFQAKGTQFLLDGKPFVIRSGEMHYPRVPEAYWRARLHAAKAMGLNTVCTYVFWNLHEPKPGKFDFSGNLDLAKYIRTAQEEGLYVIVRPGPYICTEDDFGGLPAWLLKDREMTVRSDDPKFLKLAGKYFKKVGDQIRPLLIQNGGPVIMAQVENEYGSYGNNHAYMGHIRDLMKAAGFECQLFTSDGPGQDMLSGGTLPDLPAAVNFGGGAQGAFEELAKFRPNSPRMIGEYWDGWFDHWGEHHHTTSTIDQLKDVQWCLDNGVSFNLYMFHGGTNWGFMQGANGSQRDYSVDTTSYDYDSPLDESGRPTPKYDQLRAAILKATGESPVAPGSVGPTVEIPACELSESSPILGNLPKQIYSEAPQSFEDLDQAHGLIYYRADVLHPGKRLTLDRLGDYAIVFVNGKQVGVIDRRLGQDSIDTSIGAFDQVGILVEALSRVNFGHLLPAERKGINGSVSLDGIPLQNWYQFKFPLEEPTGFKFSNKPGEGPRMYRGELHVADIGDSFLDMRRWNRGFVWVNGHNLGRFWNIGPQQTLYLPGPWLHRGNNEVVVYDSGPFVSDPKVQGLSKPILDDPHSG